MLTQHTCSCAHVLLLIHKQTSVTKLLTTPMCVCACVFVCFVSGWGQWCRTGLSGQRWMARTFSGTASDLGLLLCPLWCPHSQKPHIVPNLKNTPRLIIPSNQISHSDFRLSDLGLIITFCFFFVWLSRMVQNRLEVCAEGLRIILSAQLLEMFGHIQADVQKSNDNGFICCGMLN